MKIKISFTQSTEEIDKWEDIVTITDCGKGLGVVWKVQSANPFPIDKRLATIELIKRLVKHIAIYGPSKRPDNKL